MLKIIEPSIYTAFHFVSTFLVLPVTPYKMYQSSIPNGDNVPNPCDQCKIWNGVGHQNFNGGGDRNPFGKDFEKFGKTWNKTLCKMDSDGDGHTNGEELGDPECVWSEGILPQFKTGLSHPGICDPFHSDRCKQKNSWINCESGKFKCDAIKEAGVKAMSVRLPTTRVPRLETTYMCMRFKLPTDGDYHLIAEEPIIDNNNVLHHIILFGCKDLEGNTTLKWPFLYFPFRCNMAPSGSCNEILSLWTFGLPGHCSSKYASYRIGTKGYKYAALQVHWNNPKKYWNYIDSSGLILYYTSKLRPYDAGTITIGQMYLEIPPELKNYTATGLCDKNCSSMLIKSPIYIVEGINHMHYLGKSEMVEVFRSGKIFRVLTNDSDYTYDNPVSHSYDSPVEVLPGDELKTTCVFQSLGMKKVTRFGEDTAAEMCFAFLIYYPKNNVMDNLCPSFKSIPYCKFSSKVDPQFNHHNGCNMTELKNYNSGFIKEYLEKAVDNCNPVKCTADCKHVVKEMLQHPCLQGEILDFVTYYFYEYNRKYADLFFNMINPCRAEIESEFNLTTSNTTYAMSDSTETLLNATRETSADFTMHGGTHSVSYETETLTNPTLLNATRETSADFTMHGGTHSVSYETETLTNPTTDQATYSMSYTTDSSTNLTAHGKATETEPDVLNMFLIFAVSKMFFSLHFH